MSNKNVIGLVLTGLLLAGCASSIPPSIRQAPQGAPDLASLRAAPDEYRGRKVRFGGRIVAVENHQNESWINIVGLPLQKNGKPRQSDQTAGRFIAQVDGFVDPAIYHKNRRVTVVGQFTRMLGKKIGDYDYAYPLIKVDEIYLWPREPEVEKSPVDPFWPYAPWYAPYHHVYPYTYPYPRGKLICKTKACS